MPEFMMNLLLKLLAMYKVLTTSNKETLLIGSWMKVQRAVIATKSVLTS